MSPGQSKGPSNSIKVVPGRSKLRVESSNPVARGNPIPKTSKVKLITPEEAIQLSFPVFELPRPKPSRATSESLRHKPARATPEAPRPIPPRQTPEAPIPVPVRPTSEAPRPAPAYPEAPRPIPPRQTPEAPIPVPVRPTSDAPRPAPARPAAGLRKEIVCGLRAFNENTTPVRQRTNPRSRHQSRTVEPPPSPRALQIRSRVKQQAANATQVVEGTVVEVDDKAKDHGSKEACQSTSVERLSELLLHRPALHPTWKGRIVDTAMLPEFDCEFWAKPASSISRKALRLSKAMPTLLKVELLPTGHILNDVFDRSPRLSDVELYLFPDEKKTERLKGEHAYLFKAMATRSAMIKANTNGTELLIFSSKLLDKTSQFIIKTQYKTENYLWGFFLQNKKSEALVPGTSYQTDKDLDDGDVVDMDLDLDTGYPTDKDLADGDVVDMDLGLDTGYPTPSLALKLIAESQSIPSSSPGNVNREVSLGTGFENPSKSWGKVNEEVSVPPGFEKIWTPPLVTLQIHGTSNTLSDQTGSAGLVRNQSGKWLFGYSRCHKSLSEVAAGLLAINHGLKLLWDSGFRRIRLETTSLEIIDALTTKPNPFQKRKSILGWCKDMILKDWECEIYHISKEQNSCAEWLASRSEGQLQGLVYFEYPPRGLVGLLEKDRLAAI